MIRVSDRSTFLFDLDGTLIDSLPAVERAWQTWATSVGLDPVEILPKIHGRRSFETISELVPHLDPLIEDEKLRRLESTDTHGVVLLPGSIELLRSIPRERWTIVTSGTSDVAQARMKATGVDIPAHAVYGENVTHGKPNPEPYLLAAERMGVAPSRCLVFEDTDAGVTSGVAAGMVVVRIGGPHPLAIANVANLSSVRFERDEIVIA
jgi:sugar-phosphatase